MKARVCWARHKSDLSRMVADGWPMARIAVAFGTTRSSVGSALHRFGIVYAPEHREANRLAALRANAKRPEWRQLHSKAQKAAQARDPELLAARIRAITTLTPEARARAGRKMSASRLAHIPPQFHADYRHMIRRKHIPAADALAILKPQIQAWLQTHEGRLWRVANGQARLVANVKVSRPATYAPSQMSASMS